MAFLFIYIPFSSEIESVPYISFVRIVEAPVTSRVSSLYFKLSQQTDVRMQGPCVHPSGRGESSWSWITCLRSFFHLLFGVCHLPSGWLLRKEKAFLSSVHDNGCLVETSQKPLQALDLPRRRHSYMEGWLQVSRVLWGKFLQLRSKRCWWFP